ncbi:hypothetical protein OR16_04352 [Cupriavidus basilensis OR16]|uniref:Uncharacterized protein n=1 Tax=Cupriavidus basilensis OR16 TaxID=1127483 RepID=H1RZW4_9BURK|nr:hypothetical protein [Cupriavidus basilensis]EHP44180.1 hypothetical protein OR16_04352 [Cupriavidus basilensis OR16]
MPPFEINDTELDALAGAGADLFHLYCLGFRSHMEPLTGVVRTTFEQVTERVGRPGIKYLAHDKSTLHRMLEALVELGLLCRLEGDSSLTYICALADTTVTPREQEA